jgi:hypothetical protein
VAPLPLTHKSRMLMSEATARPPPFWGSRAATEVVFGGVLFSHDLAVAVPLALEGLTSGFGMGPGVSLSLWPP